MPSPILEDRQLLYQCLCGDACASEQFVRKFSDLIYRSIQHILILKQVHYTRDDLEDLHNTVFMHLFENKCKKLRQYEGKNGCSLATWVRTVTVRIVLNYVRKKGIDGIEARKRQLSLDDIPEIKQESMSAWELLEQSEQGQIIQDGIKKLAPRDRLFVKLHFDQGLSLADVAQTMGISVQNAYTIKHRALQKLKSNIKLTPLSLEKRGGQGG